MKTAWTLDSVRNGRLWYVTRNLLLTTSLTILFVFKVIGCIHLRAADDA